MTPNYRDGVQQILRRMARVITKLEALEAEVDGSRCDLEALLDGLAHLHHPNAVALVANRHRALLERTQEQYAAAGAKEIKRVPAPGGGTSFLIDGQNQLKLPSRLAALLLVLIQPDGASPDALVPWKSRTQVCAALQAQCGCVISDHALTQLVWRLRLELGRQTTLHRNFVMVDSHLGLRFALQQKPVESNGKPVAPLWP